MANHEIRLVEFVGVTNRRICRLFRLFLGARGQRRVGRPPIVPLLLCTTGTRQRQHEYQQCSEPNNFHLYVAGYSVDATGRMQVGCVSEPLRVVTHYHSNLTETSLETPASCMVTP